MGDHVSKGRYTFYLKDFKDVTFQITTTGKLSIWYPEEVGYEFFLKRLKPLLVKADGTPAERFDVIWESIKPERRLSLEQRVKRTIEELRFILMRDPKILEIAYEIGETPEAIRKVAFKLSPK